MRGSLVVVLAGLSMGFFVAGCGSTPEPDGGSSLRTLAATEVRETLVDNSLYRRGGAWEVGADDLYCRTWSNHWGEGQRGCFRVSRDGDTLVFDHVSGSRSDADRYTFRLLSGNSHGL